MAFKFKGDFSLFFANFKGKGKKATLAALVLLVVSVAWQLISGSSFSPKIDVFAPITMSQEAPLPSLPAEPISGNRDVKARETVQRERTAMTVKNVKHADVSGNIVTGFDKAFVLENIQDLRAIGNEVSTFEESAH